MRTSIVAGAKRCCYLAHRWTGVAACALMLLWFISGVVMLFVGYPKLTPWERLGALPPLRAVSCCVAVDSAPEMALTSIRGRPYYRLRDDKGRYRLLDAATGTPAATVDRGAALAAAQAFIPRAAATYLGQVDEDSWTHSRGLNPHRPLHMVQMDDAAHTLLYLSSSTGEVVLDAPRAQRLWNYAGAWLHWLYMFRDRAIDPVWSWIVIVLSAVGTLTALSGSLIGIWRWRFSHRYKSGSRSPYREPYLRWHHITGLLFAGIVCTWIFSGLMSMNPLGIFDAKGERPDLAAYRGGTPAQLRLGLTTSEALALLDGAGFRAVELEWRVLGGRPYLLARDAAAQTRLLVANGAAFEVRERWRSEELLAAAARLMPAALASQQWLAHYDAYYYGRQPEAMMGASEKRLPVLLLRFSDPHDTWSYIDPHTGDLALSLDRSQRLGRWLFSFLHSWDLPAMLATGAWRDAILILLSLGGSVLSATALVVAYRRVRLSIG